MNYRKVYDAIMERARHRKLEGVYLEKHHVIPCFMYKTGRKGRGSSFGTIEGDADDASNIVSLTAKEHFVAHLLLLRIVPEKYKYSAISALRVMCSDGAVNSIRYSMHREMVSKFYSNKVKGTLVVKDAVTGEMVGRLDKNHPKILSGEYVFYQKGITRSKEFRDKQRKVGNTNSHYSGVSDETYIKSYLKLCSICEKFVPSKDTWIKWGEATGEPILKTVKGFRFEGRGFQFLYSAGEELLGVKYDEYFTRDKSNAGFMQEFLDKTGVDIAPKPKRLYTREEIIRSYTSYVEATDDKHNIRAWIKYAQKEGLPWMSSSTLSTVCDVNELKQIRKKSYGY